MSLLSDRIRRALGHPLAVVAVGAALIVLLGTVGTQWREDAAESSRPQEPRAPFPYLSREVRFAGEGVELAGTLCRPRGEGPFPAVALLSGAGPQDRDGTLAGHKRFLVLADALCRSGIAVLRTDDRGVGDSGGDLFEARYADFAGDARAAVELLREEPTVDPARVGLVGASEGSLVAPLAAVDHPEIAFVVLLSAVGLPGRDLFIDQHLDLARAAGADDEQLRTTARLLREALGVQASDDETESRRQKLRSILLLLEEAQPGAAGWIATLDSTRERQIDLMLSPAMAQMLDHDPRPVLRALRIPVFALWGGLDLQVAPHTNRDAVAAALDAGTATGHQLVILPGLNHLLQPADTGLPREYGEIETTLAPAALSRIVGWVRAVGRSPAAGEADEPGEAR